MNPASAVGFRGGLHRVHEALGASWTREDGWDLPRRYEEKEGLSLHRVPVLADESCLTKYALEVGVQGFSPELTLGQM